MHKSKEGLEEGGAMVSLTAWAHMFWGYEKPAEKSQAQVFYFL